MLVSNTQDHITHAVIGGQPTMDFGISNNAEFFHILSSSLYSDQILAVIREVLCNAWDAHIEANKTDVPISVSLKDNEFIVRDYGSGIPKDQIQPIYGIYGESTKRLIGNVTGGFGLGCKAPFAYKDHFEVTSWNQGEKTIYAMCRSSSEANGKPGITPIVSMITKETGLQVKISINKEDNHKFHHKLKEVVRDGGMKVLLDLGKIAEEPELMKTIPYDESKLGFTVRLNDADSYNSNYFCVRYGNVIYPITSNAEYEEAFNSANMAYKDLLPNSTRVVFHAEPNSLCVAPSREALSFQGKTISTLKILLAKFSKVTSSTYYKERERYISKEIVEKALPDTTFAVISQGSIDKVFDKEKTHLSTIDEIIRYSLYSRKHEISAKIYHKFAARLVKPELKGTYLQFVKKRKDIQRWHYRYNYGSIRKLIDKHAVPEFPVMFLNTTSYKNTMSENHGDFYCFYRMTPQEAIKKVVILTCSISAVKTRLSHWQGDIKGSLAVIQRINRNNPNLEKLRQALSARKDITFIDLTIKHSWEIVEKESDPEPKKPKGIVRLDQLLEGHTPANPLKDAEYITKPDFVVHIARSDARLSTRFVQYDLDKIIERFGARGGICTTIPSLNSYLSKEGTQSFDDFLIDRAYEKLIKSKKIRRHHSIQLQIFNDYTIGDAILADPVLSKEMNIYTEMSVDDLFYYKLYITYKLSKSDKIKEINDFFDKAKPIAFVNKLKKVFSENVIFKYMDTRKVYNLLKGHNVTDKREIIELIKTHLKDQS